MTWLRFGCQAYLNLRSGKVIFYICFISASIQPITPLQSTVSFRCAIISVASLVWTHSRCSLMRANCEIFAWLLTSSLMVIFSSSAENNGGTPVQTYSSILFKINSQLWSTCLKTSRLFIVNVLIETACRPKMSDQPHFARYPLTVY